MRFPRRPLLFLAVALAVLATALFVAIDATRTTALHADDRIATANAARIAILDQETSLRGFLLTGHDDFLDPYRQGRHAFDTALDRLDGEVRGEADLIALDGSARRIAAQWRVLAEESIAAKRADGHRIEPVASTLERKALMDRLRAIHARLLDRLAAERNTDLARASVISTIVVVGLTAFIGLLGLALIRRATRARQQEHDAEMGYRVTQREFTDVIQVVRSEGEAHGVLKRHLERSIDGARVTVLDRNNSDDRLVATTDVEPGTALAASLRHAEPGACVAIRLARPHEGGADREALLACRVCGGVPGMTSCEPLLIGGKVIGSVLLEHDARLAETHLRVLQDSVTQAAPMLANMRTLAMAESRAATDALTGLGNRHALQSTLNRMAAHASRAISPLSAIAMDLDHFKQINDRYGHDRGDAVLATVGDLLRSFVRDSDFVSRLGGEEFVILAPDTPREGAVIVAEKLREAISRLELPGVDECVTASFGIAVMPDDAGTGELLLRHADRALYLAKELGRNRVERSSPDLG